MRTYLLRPPLVLILACILAVLLFLLDVALPATHFWGRYLLPIMLVFFWGRRRDIYLVSALTSVLVITAYWTDGPAGLDDLLLNHLLPLLVIWGVAWLLSERRQQQENLDAQVKTRTAALATREEQLAKLFRANPGGIVITRQSDGRFLEVNDAYLALVGYSRSELVGRTAVELGIVPPEEHARLAALVREHGLIRGADVVLHTKSGAPVTVVFSSELLDFDGETWILSSMVDITERQRAEDALAASMVHLRAANQRLQLAVDAADIGIWTWNFADGSLEWDERMCELYAVSPEERSAGLYYQLWRQRVHPDDRDHAGPSGGDPAYSPPSLSTTFRMVLPGGDIRYLQVNAVKQFDGDGQPLGMIGVNRDVTDQQRFELLLRDTNAVLEARVAERTADLQSALAELQHANRLKDEFMAMISHELRTPLTGVLTLSELLAEEVGGPLNARQAVYVKGIAESGERLLAVINSILSYTHLLGGMVQLAAEPCNLANLLAVCATSQQHKASAKRQAIAVQVQPPNLVVTADATALAEVLKRLLDNAVKFTPEDGRIGLEAHPGATPNTVDLVVWDTGIGIAADQIEHIFHAFTQADARLARSHEGIGIGLAYVDQMVRLMGGTITVASTLGEGSRFTITLGA